MSLSIINKEDPDLAHELILALVVCGQICTISILLPFLLDFFRIEHHVSKLATLTQKLFDGKFCNSNVRYQICMYSLD